jgi:hypothetical protein
MTDTAIAEAPAEPAPPAPEAIAEVEAMPPQAAAIDGLAPATDRDANLHVVDRSASVDAVAAPSAETPAERALPFEIEHAIGATRQAILDEFLDSDRAELSMSEIKRALPNVLPGTIEACVRRELLAGRLLKVSPGVYKLAPVSPPEAKPATPPPPPTPDEEATWFAALDGWINDPETWDRERFGPRPNEPGRRIPAGVVAKGVDRNRKRQERRRERDAGAAKQAAADAELRNTLLAAANGNFQPGPALDDVGPIREVLKVLPLDRVVMVVRQKVDRRSYPGNPPLVSWRDPAFLRALAEDFCRAFAVPGLVKEWSAAGTAPATTTRTSSPPAVPMADIDELRSHHDQEHAPPGPHSLERAEPQAAI